MRWELGTPGNCGNWNGHWSRGLIELDRYSILPLLQSTPVMIFDRTLFFRTVNEEGQAYRFQAMELIEICRLFSEASERSHHDQLVELEG
jgi:hypothetical protein